MYPEIEKLGKLVADDGNHFIIVIVDSWIIFISSLLVYAMSQSTEKHLSPTINSLRHCIAILTYYVSTDGNT